MNNAGDQEQVQRSQEKAKTRRNRMENGFRKLMQDQEGRLWVWDLLEFCGVFRSSFHQSNAQTAYNEGLRNVGLKLMADINRITPDQYFRMINEAQKEQQDG